MPNFFKSFFSGKTENPEEEKQKNAKKNFEIFKYDGLRAQRMGRPDYAIKCFNEALAIEEDFETLNYLSQIYMQTGEFVKAHELLERMIALEPDEHVPDAGQPVLHARKLSGNGRCCPEGHRIGRG